MEVRDATSLGKKVTYTDQYDPSLLCPVTREQQRESLGVYAESLPFSGIDVWNAYEFGWLNKKGKPVVMLVQCQVPCESPNLIESKSLKLYLNSFANCQFDNHRDVACILARDLSKVAGEPVQVRLQSIVELAGAALQQLRGVCLDALDITCDTYHVEPSYLTCDKRHVVSEVLHSNLLRSNCLVTGQPDWGSVQISYEGAKIAHQGLLRYIVSYRNHREFHEHCIERIFVDIMQACSPSHLTVIGCYTRRGGIDINPYRTTNFANIPSISYRLVRQ